MKSYFFLHGFLGSGEDWRPVIESIHKTQQPFLVTAPDFLKQESKYDLKSYETLIQSLRQDISSPQNVFVGYSLGGRIGLNWLRLFPQDFLHWIFISTSPGLQTEGDRKARAKSDQVWADRLDEMDTKQFIDSWNAQSVFSETKSTDQNNLNFDLEKLQTCFQNLSLATQLDHRQMIKANQNRLTWVVGKKDQKYLNMALEMKNDGFIKTFVALEGGHRLHLDQPTELADLISKKQGLTK